MTRSHPAADPGLDQRLLLYQRRCRIRGKRVRLHSAVFLLVYQGYPGRRFHWADRAAAVIAGIAALERAVRWNHVCR